jgi:cytochrome c peroxidase
VNTFRLGPSPEGARRASAVLLLGAGMLVAGCSKRPPAPGATATPVAAVPEGQTDEIPVSVRILFRPLPQKMPGSDQDTPERIALGRRLFFERGISLTNAQSCNDCHRLDAGRGGVDNRATSPGTMGISGTRNAPTVLNAGFQRMQFWDGRAADLVEQVKGPLLNPLEMAMRTEADVVNRLRADPNYPPAFARAFPGPAEPLTFDHVAAALAAFERTLITPSRFDRYLGGQTEALTDTEQRGLELFQHVGCVECHDSILVGGRRMRKLGVYHPYSNPSDQGRFEVTHEPQDRFVFKVPLLRNVTRTAPYFHDGRVYTLAEAIRLMAWMQLDVRLDFSEIDEIVAFLYALEAEHLDEPNRS